MLSNPNKTLRPAQRQHRRQRSTPTKYDPAKTEILPQAPKHALHRRGMSLDQRPRQIAPQEINVSITNQGYQQLQHQILREAQQQRLASPGQPVQYAYNANYLISPQVSPQRQNFDTASTYADQLNQVALDTICSSSNGAADSAMFDNAVLTPSAYLDFSVNLENHHDWNSDYASGSSSSTPSSATRRVSGGIAGRVAKFENLASTSSRPFTPPNQEASSYFPLTPATTPYRARQPRRDSHGGRIQLSDTSMEATVKPTRGRGSERMKTSFQEMREAVDAQEASSSVASVEQPRRQFDSAPMPTSEFMDMSTLNMEFNRSDACEPPFYSLATSRYSAQLSHESSPEISRATLTLDDDSAHQEINLGFGAEAPQETEAVDDLTQPFSPAQSGRSHRSTSVDSINIDEVTTETGITIDEIAMFIEGPDPIDRKWLCLYPDCKKRFGRKENIKSHVQTHLGDRQYQCPHCRKCFVRQHDLKRHAKIHSGVKPYPCLCGNSFARHDALTRHRQRGVCIGAFDNIVKKVVKRGRPRKNYRPDDGARLEKSSRTRHKNKTMSLSSAASSSAASSYSESSMGYSPPADMDFMTDDQFLSSFDTAPQQLSSSSMVGVSSFQFSPAHSPAATGCISPQAIECAQSPSAFSTHTASSEHQLIAGIASDGLPQADAASATAVAAVAVAESVYSPASIYNTPPELCLSSSSPAADSRYFDLDAASDHHHHRHDGIDGSGHGHHSDLRLEDFSDHEADDHDAMFMDAFMTNSHGGSLLDQLIVDQGHHGISAAGGKFDQTLGIGAAAAAAATTMAQDLFMSGAGINENDVFFGSP